MPPPTFNHLDAAQRSRLIRSTRKLGKVLGTTPCVVESVPPLPAISSSASVANKRYSVPPTPKSTFGDFTAATDFDPSEGQSRKASIVSDGESDSCSSQHTVAEASTTSFIQHRKASSDVLSPLPVFSDSETSRRKPKRLQPMLRLPPTTASNAQLLTLPPESPTALFSPDYRLDATDHVDPSTKPLPLSPTSSISPSSTEMPPTPPSKLLDQTDDSSTTLPNDVYEYPGSIKIRSLEVDESRLRKRRMEKLMRHLGECVPSELVFGSSRQRDAMSFSGALPSTGNERLGTGPDVKKNAQSRVMRRISVISGQRRRTYAEENDPTSSGCFSDPEPGTPARIHAVLMRERSKIHITRNEGRAKEKPLVEDDWTPEAYEDVVKRLRRLK
ncbi:hypothetical protein ACEPAH_7476 [Sanghuangporus vaninii]